MFIGSDEQLINALRHIEDSRLSNEVRGVAGVAADRINALRAALALWLRYNDSDYFGVDEMLLYNDALTATRAAMKKD